MFSYSIETLAIFFCSWERGHVIVTSMKKLFIKTCNTWGTQMTHWTKNEVTLRKSENRV